MGKAKEKVSFQLKTPKGTKDCTNTASLDWSGLEADRHHRGGQGHDHSRPNLRNHHRCL